MPEARRQTLDLSSQSSMYVQIGHKIFRSETVSNSKRGSPLSAKSFYSALLHKKDTAAIGAMHPTAVGFFRLLAQALQTHFSMAKANRNSKIGVRYSIFKTEKKNNKYRLTDDEFRSFSFVQNKANRNSTFGVQHSIFKTEKKNNEYRLTNDEYRSFSFVQNKANRNSKIGVRYSIFKTEKENNEYRLTDDEHRFSSNGTCSIAYLTTKQRGIKNSPDCSGYNVELAQHYLSGKRDQNFIETKLFCF